MPSTRTRGRSQSEDAREPHAVIYWRKGRAWGDFRAWAAWGGGREALVARGETYATSSRHTATLIFAERLAELRDLRELHPKGLEHTDLDRIPAYVGYHVAMMEEVKGRKPPTKQYVENTQVRLSHAAVFLAKRGVTKLREIKAEHVHDFMVHLQTHTVRGKTLTDTTQRQYMDALGHMLQRALSEGRIQRNWVREKVDLPTPNESPTELLEVGECALLLEVARRLFPPSQRGRPIYALLGFLLLTGCIESEREGVELIDIRMPGDPDFPRGLVMIRPNASRERLKTPYRNRFIPMHTQLAEILQEYLTGPNAPPGPLLFPDLRYDGSVPLGDWRKTLDQIARAAGFPDGSIRTRRFRVAYATHRLCTLDELGQPMTAWKLRGEMGHGTEQMIERRYGRYAKFRSQRPVLEFRWDEWSARYRDQFARGLAEFVSEPLRRALEVLAQNPDGLSSIDWQTALASNPGTFFPQRNRLIQYGLAATSDTGRGARYRLTADGTAVVQILSGNRGTDQVCRRQQLMQHGSVTAHYGADCRSANGAFVTRR